MTTKKRTYRTKRTPDPNRLYTLHFFDPDPQDPEFCRWDNYAPDDGTKHFRDAERKDDGPEG